MGRTNKPRRVGPGRYAVRVVIIDPRTGKRVDVRRVVRARNMAEAETLRLNLRDEALAEAAPPRLRLGDFAASWLKDKKVDLAPSTLRTYADVLENLGTLGDYYLDALTPADVVKWRAGLRTKAGRVPSPARLNGHVRVLHTVLESAARQMLVPYNAAAAVETRKVRKRAGNSLTADELAALLRAWRRTCPQWYPLFATLAATGGRWGEVTALRWEHVDFDAGAITLALSQWQGKAKDSTKTGVVRVVPLPAELAKVLQDHRAGLLRQQDRRKLASGLVFPSAVGKFIRNGDGVGKPWRAALKAAGIGRHVTPHGLRHTFNNLVRETAGDIAARALMGHVTAEMTAHYSHVGLDERRRAVAPVAALFGGE